MHMTVKELINELQKYPGDYDVIDITYMDIESVRETTMDTKEVEKQVVLIE